MEVTQQETALAPTDPMLAAWWTGATIIGHVTIVSIHWAANAFRPAGEKWWPVALLAALVIGLVIMGVAQGLALARYIENFNWLNWTAHTVFGYVTTIAIVALWIISDETAKREVPAAYSDYGGNITGKVCAFFLISLILTAIQGGIAGAAQGRLLKSSASGEAAWLRANMIATPISAFFIAIAILTQIEYAATAIFSLLFAVVGGGLAGEAQGKRWSAS